MLVKGCAGCGALYDEPGWKSLLYIGLQIIVGKHLELRRCARCGSAISIEAPQAPHAPCAGRPSPSLTTPSKTPSTRPRAPDARRETTEPCLPASYYWPPIFFVRKGVAPPSA